ncbi:MAG TPA: GNAT family N-acetyltransferase [Ktedonobacterales bacterium]|nr:GNAT family N-acetyltransferase [Ktedonobacterales bacterium]
MDDLTIRLAEPQDKAAVLAFCAHTWDWGDYIAEVWDEWLADASGRLLIAILADRPVGLLHMRMVGPDECWLEGMRVDPAMRKQGIAARLYEQAMREARQMGATVARLATHSENVVAHRVIESLGFEQVATHLHYAAAAEKVRGAPRPLVAEAQDLPALLAFLDRSNIFPVTGGLIYEDWGDRTHALTEEVLRERLAHGQVLLLRQWDDFQAIAICGLQHAAEPVLLVEYIDGTTEGVGRLAYGMRPLAAERGLDQVAITIPNLLMLRDVLEGTGYHTEDAGFFLVYQCQVDAEA